VKYLVSYTFILMTFLLKSQDKIYLVNGETKTGTLTKLGEEFITIKTSINDSAEIHKSSILIIAFENGKIQKINSAEKDVSFIADDNSEINFNQNNKDNLYCNDVSINTLAICNADVSVFFERFLFKKKLGLGIMGSYNFNTRATILNSFIVLLNNGKKNYDLGGFINFYPLEFEKNHFLHFGIMYKYMAFSYTSIKLTNNIGGNQGAAISSYTSAKGFQSATMLTTGSYSRFNNNFFIKTILGLGTFKLKNDYLEQYNLLSNNNKNNAQSNTTFILPKMYIGINLGFKL
jgi:hypothetical protein